MGADHLDLHFAALQRVDQTQNLAHPICTVFQEYDFNDDAIVPGVEWFVELVRNRLPVTTSQNENG